MIVNKSIKEIIDGYRVKQFSPVEVFRELVDQAKTINPKLNAFITINEDLGLQQAIRSEKKLMAGDDLGVLEGIPISFKDNIDTKGILTTSGSPIHKNRIPKRNAYAVKLLQDEGAVNIGKNNLYEFAFGITSKNPFFGDTINPWNNRVTAGGSSSGSAAAVAANLCFGSIGTDTAGSIRVPSSCCGVVGLKPSRDLISNQGITILSHSLDHVGPIARNVEDLSIIMEAFTKNSFGKNCICDLRGMRIGIPKLYFQNQVDSLVITYFNRALHALEDLGAIIIEIDMPIADDSRDTAHVIATSEVWYVHRDLIQSPLSEYSDGARKTFEKSKSISAHTYLEGLNKQIQLDQRITSLFENIDILVTPTIPVIPTEINVTDVELGGERESVDESLIRFTNLFNLTGHPALSIPCGLSHESIPIGLQFIANHFREDLLIKTAYSYEQAYLLEFYNKRIEMVKKLKEKALT
ncbi:amidase [Bacillus sp. ISL-18]|uniref:amidase n=1 Tax=Bacillus sp. ISL-18 TaxID=2819118 RepID=UPI001BEC5E54|nr:amidase [Bacillus sp. ISL-18]MBT2658405.1 amidase [Bacillus sp. ISL-18]